MDRKIDRKQEEQYSILCRSRRKMVNDIVFKESLLQVYQKAIEDIRALCISSMYWKNNKYPNCARILAHHHKIIIDAQVKIAELTAIEYGDDSQEITSKAFET